MSIFNFGTSKEKKNINWIALTSLEQLNEIDFQSEKEPIAIFKHSTRCNISSVVINRFTKNFDESLKYFKVYYLDLISYREVSNEISNKFEIIHESPQLLIIKEGKVISHASHYEISEIDLRKF